MKYYIISLLLTLAVSSSLAQTPASSSIGNMKFLEAVETADYIFSINGILLYQANLYPEGGDGSGMSVSGLLNVVFYGLDITGDVFVLPASEAGFGNISDYQGTAPPPPYMGWPLVRSEVNTTIEEAAALLAKPPTLLNINMDHVLEAFLLMSINVYGNNNTVSVAQPMWGFFLPNNTMCSVSMGLYAGCGQSGP